MCGDNTFVLNSHVLNGKGWIEKDDVQSTCLSLSEMSLFGYFPIVWPVWFLCFRSSCLFETQAWHWICNLLIFDFYYIYILYYIYNFYISVDFYLSTGFHRQYLILQNKSHFTHHSVNPSRITDDFNTIIHQNNLRNETKKYTEKYWICMASYNKLTHQITYMIFYPNTRDYTTPLGRPWNFL